VLVEGHTDSTGKRTFNRWLSLQLAEEVRRWLVDHGVAPERIAVHGFGPDRPLASNTTPNGRIANRQVDIFLNVR
jgi:outer membrane protein OmpA-like peptidoglycan-associated protein